MGATEDFIAHCVHVARVETDALRVALAARDEVILRQGRELAALRSHVKLLAEWQAAKRAEKAATKRADACGLSFREEDEARLVETGLRIDCEAIEASMLAADLGEEVGRG